MKRFLLGLAVLVALLPASSGLGVEEEVLSPHSLDYLLSPTTSTPIQTEEFQPEPKDPSWLIPEVGNRDLMDTKSYCDERVGITETYQAGKEPSGWQWRRFDWCQVSVNRQQGIGSYR